MKRDGSKEVVQTPALPGGPPPRRRPAGGRGARSGFSQRHGYAPVKELQVKSMDRDLRTGLWNAFYRICVREQVKSHEDCVIRVPDMLASIWTEFFKIPEGCYETDLDESLRKLYSKFYELEWHKVYDFLEFVADTVPYVYGRFVDVGWRCNPDDVIDELTSSCNRAMETERSDCRFVGTTIAPITSEAEGASLKESMSSPIRDAAKNIESALRLLSDRACPDYRNSVKESITALEAVCKHASGISYGGLTPALKALNNKHPGLVPKTLFEALGNLYGYACNEGNIRHANPGTNEIGFHTAKLILVLCSAIVNFLVHEAGLSDPK